MQQGIGEQSREQYCFRISSFAGWGVGRSSSLNQIMNYTFVHVYNMRYRNTLQQTEKLEEIERVVVKLSWCKTLSPAIINYSIQHILAW